MLFKNKKIEEYEKRFGRELVKKTFERYKDSKEFNTAVTLITSSLILSPSFIVASNIIKPGQETSSNALGGLAFAIIGSGIGLKLSNILESTLIPKRKMVEFALLHEVFDNRTKWGYGLYKGIGYGALISGFILSMHGPILGAIVGISGLTTLLQATKEEIFKKAFEDISTEKAFEIFKEDIL